MTGRAQSCPVAQIETGVRRQVLEIKAVESLHALIMPGRGFDYLSPPVIPLSSPLVTLPPPLTGVALAQITSERGVDSIAL